MILCFECLEESRYMKDVGDEFTPFLIPVCDFHALNEEIADGLRQMCVILNEVLNRIPSKYVKTKTVDNL